MRHLLLIFALITAPAYGGTRATYVRPDGGSTIIEVADNGDARIGPSDGAEYGLLVSNRFYMVEAGQNGPTVIRMEDTAAAMGLMLPRGFNELLKPANPGSVTMTELEADGTATIEGRTGRRFRMKHSDDSDRLVVSDDPSLRPIGAAMEGIAGASLLSMEAFFGSEAASDMLSHVRDMFSRGTPLLTFEGWTLTTVETAEIGQNRVRLPGKPLSLEAVAEHIRKRRQSPTPR